VRGFTADAVEAVGNFWVDLVRSILYILLPFSVLLAIGLMAEGVIHNFQTYLSVETLEGHDNLKFPMGPVAAFEAIKMIGTNGGGFFFANGAHPFANPTVFSNFLQLLAMMLLPMALCYTFGRMVDDMRQAWVLLISILGLLLFGLLIVVGSESLFMGFESDVVVESSPWAPGGNMEGKEVRFGVVGSSLFSALTTATACGATNADLSSFLGWGQWVLFLFLSTGEVIFGGAGIGFCGILGIALLTVFFVGLMLGRTPEYLRKKIEIFEVKMMALMFMVPPISLMFVLCLCIAVYYPVILKSESLSIVLYNLFSVVYNNGSAFSSGISGPFWNVLTAILMLLGRFSMVVSVIGLGYSLAQKPKLTVNPLSLSTTSALFCFLLWVVIFLMSTLSYMPFLALGPMLKLF
jgi:K+-transporting ATPase ATPase A chain